MDSIYRPGIDTPFSPSIFDDFQMEASTAANPINVDDEEDKEISAPTTKKTRVWASNRTSGITEKSPIPDLAEKCAWLRKQDSVSLNFVFDTLYVFCVYK